MLTATKPQQQTTCNQCPLWQASTNTPNVGECQLYHQRTPGHDKAGENCPTPLNTYKVDLFQDGEWVAEVKVKAADIKGADRAVMALGGDFAWNHPRLCRSRRRNS